MARDDVEVVVVGGGAAGIAAARRLHDASIDCLLVEARSRLGGRAWTVIEQGYALDLGCGWLHSADRNPWREHRRGAGCDDRQISGRRGRGSRSNVGFPASKSNDFRRRWRHSSTVSNGWRKIRPTSRLGRFSSRAAAGICLFDALSTYISGAEWESRLGEGLRPLRRQRHELARGRRAMARRSAAHGADLPVALDCPVRSIDHGGKRLRIETAQGVDDGRPARSSPCRRQC